MKNVSQTSASMDNKSAYAELCRSEKSIPVFMQNWWMDAVCAGKQWDVWISRDENGLVEAAMPYLVCTKWHFFRYIQMPQMTQIGGIWLREDIRKDAEAVSRIAERASQYLQSLKLLYYYQQYPLDSPLPQVMEANKLRLRRRITYRIEDLSDLEKVIDAFTKNKRRQLQRALALHGTQDLNGEVFYAFHRQCMDAQKKRISYTREFLLVLERKCERHQCGRFIGIRNADGVLYAAAFVVWDNRSLYYLIPCYAPEYKNSGAGALLVLETIKLARQLGVAFDFEGSMVRSIANHYRQFGSEAHPYYAVENSYCGLFRILLWAQHLKAHLIYHL